MAQARLAEQPFLGLALPLSRRQLQAWEMAGLDVLPPLQPELLL